MRLADRRGDGHARVQAGVGVLEDHLEVAPAAAASRPRDRPTRLVPAEPDVARRDRHERHDRARHGRLPAARLPHQAQRLAAPQLEAHAVHGAHHAPRHREVDPQVLDLEDGSRARSRQLLRRQDAAAAAARGRRSRAAARPARQASRDQGAPRREGAGLERAPVEARRQPLDALQARVAVLVEARHAPRAAPACRGGWGSRRGRRVDASSTIRPAYITSTRSHVPGDDAQVVRDEDDRHAALVAQLLQELEDLRLDRHVERRGRLVGDQERRGRRAAPWRSSRAGACRRRTRAGSAWMRSAASGMPDAVEQLDGARHGLRAREAEVQLPHLGELLLDPQVRIQARHRVLEDHRDPVAADLPQLPLRTGRPARGPRSGTLPPAIRPCGLGSRPRIERFVTLFPQPGLADEADDLAPVDLEGDAVDGADEALLGHELRPQVRDVAAGGRRRALIGASSGRGRRAGRRPGS